jgi:hypothetical protein
MTQINQTNELENATGGPVQAEVIHTPAGPPGPGVISSDKKKAVYVHNCLCFTLEIIIGTYY